MKIESKDIGLLMQTLQLRTSYSIVLSAVDTDED